MNSNAAVIISTDGVLTCRMSCIHVLPVRLCAFISISALYGESPDSYNQRRRVFLTQNPCNMPVKK